MNKFLLLLALLISFAHLYAQQNRESETVAIERHKEKLPMFDLTY